MAHTNGDRYAGHVAGLTALVEEIEQGLGANVCPARVRQCGLLLAHLPARAQRVPLEVNCQGRPDPVRDTLDLCRFIERPVNRAPFGLLAARSDDEADYVPGIVAQPLSTLMLLRRLGPRGDRR